MSVYESIKNPLNIDENILDIVKAYLNIEREKGGFYSRIVSIGGENTQFNLEEYLKFERKINKFELDKIRKANPLLVKLCAPITYCYKSYSWFRNLPVIGKLCGKLSKRIPTYSNYKLTQEKTNEELLNKYEEVSQKSVKDRNQKDKDLLWMFDDYIYNHHNFSGLAGYHVYQSDIDYEGFKNTLEEFKAKWRAEKEKGVEPTDEFGWNYKFYLNMDFDHLYKFADKFMELCDKNNVDYEFKVLTPRHDKADRCEKMCIYVFKDNFLEILKIIQAIKYANPKIKFKRPPIFSGIVDENIGIGSDGSDMPMKTGSSNSYRADIVERALLKYFNSKYKGLRNEQIWANVKTNPKEINSIRNAIKSEAFSGELDHEKFCFSDVAAELLKREEEEGIRKDLKITLKDAQIAGLSDTETFRSRYSVGDRTIRTIEPMRNVSNPREEIKSR